MHSLTRLPLIAFCRHIGQRLMSDNCQRSAAALTYMSLFAIVPLMTVTFALFSAIPAFDSVGEKIQSLLFEYFVPTAGSDIQGYLQEFSRQAQKLTIWGFAFLAVTAYMMLRNIEKAFNDIWNTRGNRKGLSGFLLYWAILSLGPLLLGIGFVASTYLLSLDWLRGPSATLGIGTYLLDYLPLLTQTMAFTLLYYAVPNCHVPFRHALLGGIFTAFTFETAKILFTFMVSNASYELVYGAFASVPLFLLWIYLSWLLLLAGAEFVRALSSFGDSQNEQADLLVALAMLGLFREQHRIGRTLDETQLLDRRWKPGGKAITRERWESVRNRLIDMHVIAATDDGCFVLAHDLATLKLHELAAAFGGIDQSIADPDNSDPVWLINAAALLKNETTRRQHALSIPVESLYPGTHDVA
ncbi:MAG: YihY family inner membrane protein [Gammaproteobacteria bacterium]|nr:MAG: YihY family inner membrane protein [Gammaproteobacteria bacterium]